MPLKNDQNTRSPFQPPRGVGSSKSQLLASAGWCRATEIYQSGSIYLGRNGRDERIGINDDRHIFTAAGNRSGKGTSLIVPNLFLWPGSAVVIDPKGENAAITAKHRACNEGHKVLAIDPLGESGLDEEFMGRFNPLELIDIESDEAIDTASMIADSLVVKTNQKDTHWDESARDLIAGLILHVCDTEIACERTLGRVHQLLNKGDPEFAEVMYATALENRDENDNSLIVPPNPFHALWTHMSYSEAANADVCDTIIGAARCIMEMGDNERGSVLSTARRNTRFIGTPKIKQALAASNFDIDAVKTAEHGMTLYLCLPARMFPTHARFLRLIISILLFRMEEIGLEKPACGHPVLFILDEFASLGHMEMLEKAAGLMAGYGVKLWPIVQDLSQMQKHYKESWQTFLSNAGTMMFFANSDLTTLEWLSKRIGETEIIRENEAQSTSETEGQSRSDSESRSEGRSYSDSNTQSTADMAPLSETAAVEGGHSLFDVFNRRTKRSSSNSQSQGRTEGGSEQSSHTHQQALNSSKTTGSSKSEQIHKTSLMTPDELARYFKRESGMAIAFISGEGPFAIKRTPYFECDGLIQFTLQ